jgi:pimeloyl-ACP methyl ester carboxylesterase
MLRATTLPGGITASIADAAGDRRPPLLFVHGMFGGAWQFAEWQLRLAGLGYSSTAIDLRVRHAEQPATARTGASLRDYVDATRSVARMMGRPAVVGHSMGGLVAQKLAEESMVSAAVLVCSAPPRWISALSGALLERMLKYAPQLLFSRPIAPRRSDAVALFLERIPLEERDRIFERIDPESGRVARELALGTLAIDASRVRCPVLSIGAVGDRFLPPRIARAIARKYHGDYHEYAEHGHYIIGEPGWEQVADDVAAWIAEHA